MSTSGGGGGGGDAVTNGGDATALASFTPSSVAHLSGEERLKQLESLFCDGPEGAHQAKSFSTETLLDILLILYNECCNSSLRKEKTVTDFIELGKKETEKKKMIFNF